MEWVLVLMLDLKAKEQSDYANHLLQTLTSWLEKGKSKLDPKEFRTLYIKKISQD